MRKGHTLYDEILECHIVASGSSLEDLMYVQTIYILLTALKSILMQVVNSNKVVYQPMATQGINKAGLQPKHIDIVYGSLE